MIIILDGGPTREQRAVPRLQIGHSQGVGCHNSNKQSLWHRRRSGVCAFAQNSVASGRAGDAHRRQQQRHRSSPRAQPRNERTEQLYAQTRRVHCSQTTASALTLKGAARGRTARAGKRVAERTRVARRRVARRRRAGAKSAGSGRRSSSLRFSFFFQGFFRFFFHQGFFRFFFFSS
ncbi:hypothetical protein T492DRAFT_78780 [Pavlovales sp. CCMP2436]|nr:hypothetical protein T492DRAFT_78780 [Pavlovales sp. CCMP2436]